GPEVVVDSTPRGPWTPTGTLTSAVLNPDGDLAGDSVPGWTGDAVRVLTAWTRPTSGDLEQAVGTSGDWQWLPAIAAPGSVGTPIVNAVSSGWLISWQQVDGGGSRALVTASGTGGSLDPEFVADGLLVGTIPLGDVVEILTLDPAT